jgi:hypothetical protein
MKNLNLTDQFVEGGSDVDHTWMGNENRRRAHLLAFCFFWMVTLLGVGISTDRYDSYSLNVVLYRLIDAHVPH